MYTVLMIVQVLTAVGLVGLILLQHGKGADAGAAFGSGASGTVFGSRGSANFMSRATSWLATVFFAVSLALAYLVHGEREASSVIDRVQPAAQAAPNGAEQSQPPVVIETQRSPATEQDTAPVIPE
jgi:preprotein translocase subunit SecG